MLKNLKKRIEGFTIIEVLIVLAIAGLILLIVFLAVPALQRNSRNTSRRADVAALLAGVNEYAVDNQNIQPDKVTPNAATDSSSIKWSQAAAPAGEIQTQTKLGYYTKGAANNAFSATPATATVNLTATPPAAAQGPVTTDGVEIIEGAQCSGNTAIAGGARQFVALYQVEGTAGSLTGVCQSS